MALIKSTLCLAAIAGLAATSYALDFDGVRVANIEKHNGNYSNCPENSGDFAWFRFRKADGTLTGYYAVSIASSAYKDMLSLALTALVSGAAVNVRGTEVPVCSNSGTLTALNLVGD